MNDKMLITNRVLNNIIGDMEVKCKSITNTTVFSSMSSDDQQRKKARIDECTWQGCLRELPSHESNCDYRWLVCLDCQIEIKAKEINTHRSICPKRLMACKFCNEMFPGGEHENCGDELIQCKFCNEQVKRKNLGDLNVYFQESTRCKDYSWTTGAHKDECQMLNIICPYETVTGCKFECLRKDMACHVMNVSIHLTGFLEHTVKLTTKYNELQQQCDDQQCKMVIQSFQRELRYPLNKESTEIPSILQEITEMVKAPDFDEPDPDIDELYRRKSNFRYDFVEQLCTPRYLGQILSKPNEYTVWSIYYTLDLLWHLLYNSDEDSCDVNAILHSVVAITKPVFLAGYEGFPGYGIDPKRMILVSFGALSRLFQLENPALKIAIWTAHFHDNMIRFVDRNLVDVELMRGVCALVTGVVQGLKSVVRRPPQCLPSLFKAISDIFAQHIARKTIVNSVLTFFGTIEELLDGSMHEGDVDGMIEGFISANILPYRVKELLAEAISKYPSDGALVSRCRRVMSTCC